MIHHVWSILCRSSSVDSESNNISIFSVIEQFKLELLTDHNPETDEESELVPIPSGLQLVTLWRREPRDEPEAGRYRARFRLEEQILEPQPKEIEIDLRSAPRLRSRLNMFALPLDLSRTGDLETYWFDIELLKGDEWVRQASVPLDIEFHITEADAGTPADDEGG